MCTPCAGINAAPLYVAIGLDQEISYSGCKPPASTALSLAFEKAVALDRAGEFLDGVESVTLVNVTALDACLSDVVSASG